MSKLTMTNSSARDVAGRLATIAGAGPLAVSGCTTNLNPGSGEPLRGEPGLGPRSPTSTPGTSYGSNVPMTSAYNADVSSGAVNAPMISSYFASDPAASRSDYRTKYLGASDPAPGGVVVVEDHHTGQLIDTAAAVNPQSTVNPTLSSPGTPAVIDDANGIVFVPVTANGTGTNGTGTTAGTTSAAGGPTGTGGTAPLALARASGGAV